MRKSSTFIEIGTEFFDTASYQQDINDKKYEIKERITTLFVILPVNYVYSFFGMINQYVSLPEISMFSGLNNSEPFHIFLVIVYPFYIFWFIYIRYFHKITFDVTYLRLNITPDHACSTSFILEINKPINRMLDFIRFKWV